MEGGETCPDCDGRGSILDQAVVPCKNCDGQGSCAAGRGNRFVCTICRGAGERPEPREQKCETCGGRGWLRSSGGQGFSEAASSVPRSPRAANQSMNGSRGVEANVLRTEEVPFEGVGSLEARGSSPTNNTAPQGVPPPAAKTPQESAPQGTACTVGATQTAAVGDGPAQPRVIKAANTAIASAGKAGISGEGLHWEADTGLAVHLKLTSTCLSNSGGFLLSCIGFIMMVAGSTGWVVLGTFFFLGGLLIIVVVNKHRCRSVLQMEQPALEAERPTQAPGASLGAPKSSSLGKRNDFAV